MNSGILHSQQKIRFFKMNATKFTKTNKRKLQQNVHQLKRDYIIIHNLSQLRTVEAVVEFVF